MPQDARVTSAIAHWAPRFVANGVTLTDFEEVTASVSSWDDWCAAWSGRAARARGARPRGAGARPCAERRRAPAARRAFTIISVSSYSFTIFRK